MVRRKAKPTVTPPRFKPLGTVTLVAGGSYQNSGDNWLLVTGINIAEVPSPGNNFAINVQDAAGINQDTILIKDSTSIGITYLQLVKPLLIPPSGKLTIGGNSLPWGVQIIQCATLDDAMGTRFL